MLLVGVLTMMYFLKNAVKDLAEQATAAPTQPHIVFILTDDMGWDDVSYHGSKQIPTPNIDLLAHNGVILNNYYVQPVCTPTRSALLTGKYPIHNGMQKGVIYASQRWGLGLNETLLPQYLKQLGYRTHAVGKWHLGFYSKKHTPVERGFDSFYGFYNGAEGYYNRDVYSTYVGVDFQRNGQAAPLKSDQYGTELFTAEAESIIHNHNTSSPMFLYLAHQAVHHPLHAPQDWINKFSYIKHKGRRKYAAMMSYLDYSVGRVYKALVEKGMADNSIIIFSTDNGGPANGFGGNYASNYPLRGMKRSLWEGGIRAAGFVYSELLRQPGRVSNEMMHVTDWMPTIISMAGGDPSTLPNMDGYDQWDTLRNSAPSPRSEILLNIMEDKTGRGWWQVKYENSGIRVGDWKLIMGQPQVRDGWYPPPNAGRKTYNSFTTVDCGPKPTKIMKCDVLDGPCLFNIKKDPCEYRNVRDEEPTIYNFLLRKLESYRKSMVPARINYTVDPRSNPKRHNGYWRPYVDVA